MIYYVLIDVKALREVELSVNNMTVTKQIESAKIDINLKKHSIVFCSTP